MLRFETCKELKHVGFPQPEQQPGQMWYNDAGDLLTCIYADYFVDSLGNVCSPGPEVELYFAPTATDILKQIPLKSLTFFPGDSIDDPWWQVEYFDEIKPNGTLLAEHANPAEACAAAWLSLIKK